ncbi:hypothetical protein [Helicobacter turcicus]|uniref:Uncharacterized protein n=1 Tax=Helicobacter turcicus TaxID=2867412 RepID=A0ABS7JNQ3_9HELI|nr:hypothetical protein [Helicobacter turcicus]MBX7491034.1 hypothetical protein [Helicobacter turcicus]MBX7546295.1 hypothetical protein [Helicobacter turcicus]
MKLSQEQADRLALSHWSYSSPEHTYSLFFSHVDDINRLSPQQKEEIIEAIAKMQVYEYENGVQIYNAVLKKHAFRDWKVLSLIDQPFDAQSFIMLNFASNFDSTQSIFEILEQKDKLERENQELKEESKKQQALKDSGISNTTFIKTDSKSDSIMQILLKDSKDLKEAKSI